MKYYYCRGAFDTTNFDNNFIEEYKFLKGKIMILEIYEETSGHMKTQLEFANKVGLSRQWIHNKLTLDKIAIEVDVYKGNII